MGRTLVILIAAFLVAISGSSSDDVSALSTCLNTEVVGVRGSGQMYGESEELSTIKHSLPGSIKFAELENEINFLNEEAPYRAIPVAGSPQDMVKNGGVALIARSEFGEYRKSVNSGKNLLKKYIEHFQPTSTCLVLVGYSQGAQVVGETVRDMHKDDPSSLKNVIYVGLLGDPQYSPYGFDKTMRPAWLRGDALYPYTGALGAREPDYIPRNPSNKLYPFTKIGSWCNYGDVICATDTSHYAAMRDGHGTYTGDSAIELVDEIKAAIATPDQNITGTIYPNSTCGVAKQDLVVLLDTSAYMRRNKDLFTKDKNTWDTKLLPGTNQRAYRTFGEQLLDSGCGDKRVAIVGFEGPSGEPPRVLLDFTSNPQDINILMESLYRPSVGGVAEKPLLREAAILGMQQGWRPDASRTLLAISSMAGSGVVSATWRDNWGTAGVMDRYMNDAVGQDFLKLSRQTRAAMITALHLPIDMNGFSLPAGYPASNDAYNYYQSIARLTGGYNWEKVFYLYPSRHTVKNVDFSSQILQFEKRRDGTRVAAKSVRAKVGQPVTLSLDDTANLLASARVRGHGAVLDWYLNCDALQARSDSPVIKQVDGRAIFTPTKAGSCTAAVRVAVQGTGNGCYWGCPEPFPPYMLKVIPFRIDVRPADYIERVPGDITVMKKTIYDDHIELTWEPPQYTGNNLVYFVKDTDGSVMAATTERKAVLTETGGQDIEVFIQTIGEDGRSANQSSMDKKVVIIDERVPPKETEEVITNNPGPTSEKPSLVSIASQVAEVKSPVREEFEKVEVTKVSGGQTLGQAIDNTVVGQTKRSDRVLSITSASSENWWWVALLVIASAWTAYRIRLVIRRA